MQSLANKSLQQIEVSLELCTHLWLKNFNIGTKNLARLYVGVSKADKIGQYGVQPSICCLFTFAVFPKSIRSTRLVPTGFMVL